MAYIALSDLTTPGLGQSNPGDAVLAPIGAGLSEGLAAAFNIILGVAAVGAVLGGVAGYKLGDGVGALLGAPLGAGLALGTGYVGSMIYRNLTFDVSQCDPRYYAPGSKCDRYVRGQSSIFDLEP